ncbi:MAG: hypothetical protein AB7V12_11800 [Candidatus Dadabacteria bacterium]
MGKHPGEIKPDEIIGDDLIGELPMTSKNFYALEIKTANLKGVLF